MAFLIFIYILIALSQDYKPSFTLVSNQSLTINTLEGKTYDGNQTYEDCDNNVTIQFENYENYTYVEVMPFYRDVKIFALQRIYCIYEDSLTYLFAILFNDTKLALRLNDPMFFSDEQDQQIYDLEIQLKINLSSCYEMHRALDNTKFDIICVNQTHRIFVELLINNTEEGYLVQNLSYNLFAIEQTNQSLRSRTLRESAQYYVILFNNQIIELFICEIECQNKNFIQNNLTEISDIQLLKVNNNTIKFAISLNNSGFYIYDYNYHNQQLSQIYAFKTYDGQQYLNLCIFSYTLWYGNDPSSIYPEIVLLTSNFVHIFKYLSEYNQTNILISSKRFQIGETIYEDYKDYLINQDDKYIYITRRNKKKQTQITYVQKSEDDQTVQTFNGIYSDLRPFITTYDMIDKTTSLYNKNIHICSFKNNSLHQQVNKIQDNIMIIKSNAEGEFNCTLNISNQSFLIENINLNSLRILIGKNESISFNTLIIEKNMQEVFKGQLLNFSASASKRINSNQIGTAKQVNQYPYLPIQYPQQIDQYCVIHSVYDPIQDKAFTIYQLQNKRIFLFISYEFTADFYATSYVTKFEQIENYLLFSYYENESNTSVQTIIYNLTTNTTTNLTFNQSIFQNLTSLDEELISVQQLSHFNQKVIYYFIKTKTNNTYMVYFRFLDESQKKLCIFFNESQYQIQYIQFDLQRYNLFIASAINIISGNNNTQLVYFRLPILYWEGCLNTQLFEIQIEEIQYSKDIEFWLVDYQFIDNTQPIQLVIIDFTNNTLTKYSLRDLKNITYKYEKFPLPLFDNLNLTHQKLNDMQIIGNNKYQRKGALYYCRVIFQYLILNVVEDNTLKKIYQYDLLGESGNQVQLLYESVNNSNTLIFFPKAYLSQQTNKSFREILRYGQGTITSNYSEQTYYNLSFNYKTVPTFQINLRTDSYFQSHIYGYKFNAKNSFTHADQSVTIKIQDFDINCQITNSSQLKINSSSQVNLSNFKGPSFQYLIRDKNQNKIVNYISFIKELQKINQLSNFEKYIKCQNYSYKLIIQGNKSELVVLKFENQQQYSKEIVISKDIYNIQEVDGLCFQSFLQIVAIQKIEQNTQIVFFKNNLTQQDLSKVYFALSPVNIEAKISKFDFRMLHVYKNCQLQKKFEIYAYSQNTQYIFSIQIIDVDYKLVNLISLQRMYQYYYPNNCTKEMVLTYNQSNRNIIYNNSIHPIYFDFDFIPIKPIIIDDSLIVFVNHNHDFGLAYYDLSNSSSMKQYVNITNSKIIDVEFDENYKIIIIKCIERSYYYTISTSFNYQDLIPFLQQYQSESNTNYQLCSSTHGQIESGKCIDLELENYDLVKINWELDLYFYLVMVPLTFLVIIINLMILKQCKKMRQQNNYPSLRDSNFRSQFNE